jgi:hypothetical protein
MRTMLAVCLFSVASLCLSLAASGQQPAVKKQEKKGKYEPKDFFPPDAATLKTIKDKTEELRIAIEGLKAKKIKDDVLVEVEIYLKAAENIVRFEEWYAKASVSWALTTLERGLERAKQAEGGKAAWRDETGKWIVRAYRSSIDGSIQPYAVLLPDDYGEDPKRMWRLDIVLHGRDSSLTEAKFIATHRGNAPKDLQYIQIEPYGRGNNAYRWAGEADVRGAESSFFVREYDRLKTNPIDLGKRVLRGFSMGGAGTWHIGLHDPCNYCVIGPGAGFTTTHGYVGGLPAKLPDYQEKCLRIYDAVDYAENAFNVPIVAYSGEKDPQKKAADNIENALKSFAEPVQFTHLIAPGLEHQMPKEWQEKAEAEYRKYDRNKLPERVRFVTYTPRYWHAGRIFVDALEKQYEKAWIEFTQEQDSMSNSEVMTVKTDNMRRFWILPVKGTLDVTIDGKKFRGLQRRERTGLRYGFEKKNGRWTQVERESFNRFPGPPIKSTRICGPIDDAFTYRFSVVKPTAPDVDALPDRYVAAALNEFDRNWDRYFRGKLPTGNLEPIKSDKLKFVSHPNWILFGTPQSNPIIAKVLPRLPITWTKDKLTVNGVSYDPKTHVPVMIYPNPLTNYQSYVVLNSGHTFREADLKGTNALLYPRLGDWAVIKPKPTAKDPAAYEVVAAGLFDENWQFAKK